MVKSEIAKFGLAFFEKRFSRGKGLATNKTMFAVSGLPSLGYIPY